MKFNLDFKSKDTDIKNFFFYFSIYHLFGIKINLLLLPILPKKIRNKILKKILFNNYFKIITFATLLKKYHLYDVKALLNELLFGPQTIIDVNGLNQIKTIIS